MYKDVCTDDGDEAILVPSVWCPTALFWIRSIKHLQRALRELLAVLLCPLIPRPRYLHWLPLQMRISLKNFNISKWISSILFVGSFVLLCL